MATENVEIKGWVMRIEAHRFFDQTDGFVDLAEIGDRVRQDDIIVRIVRVECDGALGFSDGGVELFRSDSQWFRFDLMGQCGRAPAPIVGPPGRIPHRGHFRPVEPGVTQQC